MSCDNTLFSFFLSILVLSCSGEFFLSLVEISALKSCLAVRIVEQRVGFLCTLLGVGEIACSFKLCYGRSVIA